MKHILKISPLAALCALMLLALGSGGPAWAKARPLFEGAPLESIDEQGWSGLQFGVTTLTSVKKQFDVAKSDMEPATQIKQGKKPAREVHLLWNDKGKESPLVAIALRYSAGNELDLDELQSALKQQGQALYARERFEEWRVQTFPDKGVVAWVTGEARPKVVLMMVIAPGRLRGWQRQQPLNVEATPIAIRVDPNAEKPRIVEFGSTSVRVTLDGPYVMKDKEKAREEAELRSRTANGAIRYRAGAAGSYDIEIGGKWKAEKGGSMTITCTIAGEGPYGPIKVSGSAYKSLTGKVANLMTSEASLNYSLGLLDARASAERAVSLALLAQGPPPLSTLRLAAWDRMIADLRTTAPVED